MRQSHLFTKTLRESPKDEISANAILLERGGFVYKMMAGVYAYLPLGLRVLDKVNRILREEMNRVGGQEIVMSALQPKDIWEETGRWEELSAVMYQFKDSSERDLGLAITHEEPLTNIARRFISSYKDLPRYVYQIQLKFRNEPRAKSGLLRSREFLMKDLYSFDRDAEGLANSYEILKQSYARFFKRIGLNSKIVEASGGAFTKEFTHEFQVPAKAGEDEIVYCPNCNFAQNKEIATLKSGEKCPVCEGTLSEGTSIEVGHIYKLGTKYSEALGLFYTDEEGLKRPVFMGSYGIGSGRSIGAIAETHCDESGIIWPEAVAPYMLHLILLDGGESKRHVSGVSARSMAEKIYAELCERGVEVLWDEREDKSPGEKFADADLIGIPFRVVISPKTLEHNAIEVRRRNESNFQLIQLETFSRDWYDKFASPKL